MSETITIRHVAVLLVTRYGWELEPKSNLNDDTFNMRCHLCDDHGYHLNINTLKNVFHCWLCDSAGGALRLYAKAVHGVDIVAGTPEAQEMFEKLRTELGEEPAKPYKPRRNNSKPMKKQKSIKCASDDVLDKTFSTLLAFPHFKLSASDRESLIKRGLSNEAIDRNGYRSIDYRYPWIEDYQDAWKIYESYNLEARVKMKKRRVIAGIVIASYLQEHGCVLAGCPGFFRIDNVWIFNSVPGILIPTRNEKGQIVCFQVRTNMSDCKYLTLSSKNLPNGVTDGFSRIHFPLGNATLTPKTRVYLTEGPLKSDVAVELMNSEDTFFIALPGVNNRRMLPDVLELLYKRGIRMVYNALDMDKVTNPNVIRQCHAINEIALQHNIDIMLLYWDQACGYEKFIELTQLEQEHHLDMQVNSNDIFTATAALTVALNKVGIRLEKDYWCADTKGIDDFLLTQKAKMLSQVG